MVSTVVMTLGTDWLATCTSEFTSRVDRVTRSPARTASIRPNEVPSSSVTNFSRSSAATRSAKLVVSRVANHSRTACVASAASIAAVKGMMRSSPELVRCTSWPTR